MRRIAVIGHSHLAALQRAAEDRSTGPAELTFIQLRDERYRPLFARRTGNGGRDIVLNRRLRKDVARACGRGGAVVSCVGGNDHNVLGLLNHPRPFDFVLASNPGLPLLADREIVPGGLMREILAERLAANDLAILRALKAFCDAPTYHLESPPPIPSEDYIRRFPGVFRARLGEFGVTPASLRYKMWRLHSEIVWAACKDAGISFLPVPAETQDDDGFLVDRGWNPDPTHGNAWYGACILRQVDTIVAAGDARVGARA